MCVVNCSVASTFSLQLVAWETSLQWPINTGSNHLITTCLKWTLVRCVMTYYDILFQLWHITVMLTSIGSYTFYFLLEIWCTLSCCNTHKYMLRQIKKKVIGATCVAPVWRIHPHKTKLGTTVREHKILYTYNFSKKQNFCRVLGM